MYTSPHFGCIVPPYLLEQLVENSDSDVRRAALATMVTTEHLRGRRSLAAELGLTAAASTDGGRRTVFDCRTSTNVNSAVQVLDEDGGTSSDPAVLRAFDGLGATRDFYRSVLQRSSVDGEGMALNGYVHYGRQFNNAFWDGAHMVFGDGDGKIFADFTLSIDVIAHELTHGVTEHTAGLQYERQPGALNESISDVFGSLVKQWRAGQDAADADWLIGAEVFTPSIQADALRSMKAPGTAWNASVFGRPDPQPDHMSRFVHLPVSADGDWGGVHINSGIPNKAFCLAAIGIGGKAWEAAGHIWYAALLAANASTGFQAFADLTDAKAGELCGTTSPERDAVRRAWDQVGIRTVTAPAAPAAADVPGLADQIAALSAKLDRITERLDAVRMSPA
ncbi:M4 family metallopeptidase [Rhodococcus olei]|uniref:Neutral metalloproteinase n=1 Tax=Rhodococcus olei TaxID=2161675 RepID=A0ABP8PH95_9NOCA